MTADSTYSIEALERQWRDTKAPKLGLQLAEAHRRRDDLPAAIAVLEAGLEVYPEHMSSRVALSRYLVDSGRYASALEHLEPIVRVDPVHLVANKLLVHAYLGVGRLDKARDKLDIYEMLGEGDADIESLRAAVDGVPAVAGAPESPELAAGREPAALPASIDPEPPIAAASLSSDPAPAVRGPAEAAGELVLDDGDAFAPLPDQVPNPMPQARPDPVFEPAGGGAFAPAAPMGAAMAGDDEPFGSAWGTDEPPGYWDEVSGEGIFALDAAATPSDRQRDADSDEVGAAPGEAAEATVTLGNLYREQGHRDLAADTFRAVLAREPGNEAARKGLEAIEAPLSSTGEGASVNERRIAALIAYRARLRRAVAARI